MKKLTSLIPVAFIFAILAGLLFFMCLPQNQSQATAQDGILDLRGEAVKSKVAPLHGQWDFVYGKLLTPDEFANRQTFAIDVPGSWDDEGYPLNGCATYRLTILTDNSEALTLFLPEIPSSYVLWVNGKIARICGTVSADSAEGNPHFENALVPVYAQDGTIELVLQISNYHFINGGINDTILLGKSEDIQAWFVRTRAFYCVALGCILMTAFYHITLYIYRRREKMYLLFALLCFLCFVRFLMETNGLNEYFQWIPMGMFGIRSYLALFFAHCIAISAFSLYIFNRDFLLKYRTATLLCFSFVFLVSLIMPTNTTAYVLITTPVTLSVTLFSIIMAARSPVLRENGTTRLYFAAMIVYLIVGTSSKLFLDNVLFMMGLLSNMFMVMSQSLVLSRRYTDAFRFVEETNQNLEQIVDERTKSLQTANAAMQATNTAMKELVSNISHDLKTPLAVLSVNLETLSALAVTGSNADYQRHVRVAYQKNRDLQRLIQNLFEVSRIEASRNLYSPEWESMLRLLAQAKDKYDTFLEDAGILLDITVEDDMEISIDPQKVWSVFDNIIYNAVRYTESGGSITITAHNMESAATVNVTDTGCGIAPEHLPHVFERFYRGSPARGAKEGESGLGLYIVRSIMEGCGGSVEIKSEPDKGTSVILTFPARIIE